MCGWFAGIICRDFCRTLYMFGTCHCCDSSSCYSDTFEFEPASAGAERQTLLSERAVCALRFASNVQRTAARVKHSLNESQRKAAYTRSCDRTCTAETLGCRQGESNEKRVYTLPRFPGVYNNWFRSFRQRSREEENTVWAVREEDSENIGRVANAQEAIV